MGVVKFFPRNTMVLNINGCILVYLSVSEVNNNSVCESLYKIEVFVYMQIYCTFYLANSLQMLAWLKWIVPWFDSLASTEGI